MKIAFSTLGCPDFSWTDIYPMAKDLHFDGIEIRGLGNDIYAVKARPFTGAQLPRTIQKLGELGLEIPCLSTGNPLYIKENREENIVEVCQYIALAQKLSTPYIRLLVGLEAGPVGNEVDDDYIVELLKELAAPAEEAGVTLLVESNSDYADTKRLKKVLDAVNSPFVAALWVRRSQGWWAGLRWLSVRV